MAYVFDGFLSKDTQRALESNSSYAYAVHVRHLPRLLKLVQEAGLFRYYPIAREDCMGRAYIGTSHSFCMIRRDHEGTHEGFLLLRSHDEHQAIVNAFPDEVISANPFKTVMGQA